MARPTRPPGRDRKVQPPRPPNAWILYRSFQSKRLREDPKHARCSQASVSKVIAEMWKNETKEVRQHFEQEADNKKTEHQELYPDYRFCPQRKDTKKNKKKPKCRDSTPESSNTSPAVPTFPSLPFAPQPHHAFARGGGPYNLPHHLTVPYLPQVRYGPGGLSPSMSEAPSPMHYASPLSRSASSSLSSIGSRLSPSSDSSSSSHPPATPISPSFPNSHYPSPNPFATFSSLPFTFQSSAPGEPLVSSHLQSAENTLVPQVSGWNNGSNYLPSLDPRNSQFTHLGAPISQTDNFAGGKQDIPPCSYEAIQAMLAEATEIGAFNMPYVEPHELTSPPNGELEVALGPLLSPVGYEPPFFDFDQFNQQLECDSSAAPQDNLQNLLHIPNAVEVEAYIAAQQCQPNAFTHDMMNFVNFEAGEDTTQATLPVSVAPASTLLNPQQAHAQGPQDAPAPSIFTQTTNIPVVTPSPSTQYMPLDGAVFSSMHRVGSNWKPSFGNPPSQTNEAVQSWPLP